eukprot:TRINITY_DN13_c0_g3_i1.p1 TRINITY_DN13_c0_g3~~TRINITY_DN13_c0_g3_i1.p1  ORF type:complete len:764 (-),score=40.81 TRINITY_DN13_c0_g3_i1:148-2439(-)
MPFLGPVLSWVKKSLLYFQDLIKTYPQITGTSTLCSYYRKQNKTVPIIYVLCIIGIIFAGLIRAILFSAEKGYNIFLMRILPVYLAVNIINLAGSVYVFRLKRYALERTNRENLQVQSKVRKKMNLCAVFMFLTMTPFAIVLMRCETCGEPIELSWLVTFMIQLYSSIWFLESIPSKIAMLFSYNLIFCLFAAKYKQFGEALPSKIIVPIAFASVMILTHDKYAKTNFLLKRQVKEQKTVYEGFLQKMVDPVFILDQNRVIFRNEVASSSASATDAGLYQMAERMVNQQGESLNECIRKRLQFPEISPEPVKQDSYSLTNAGSQRKALIVTLVESTFFCREKTISLILRDMTAEVLQEEKRLEDKYKNMLLYSLSHELRTPLNILQGIFPVLKASALSKEQKRLYEAGKGAWNYLKNKINDTLAYAQFSTGEFSLHEETFSLSKLVRYLNKMTTFLLQNKRETIRLYFEIGEEVNDNFSGDKERLEQVLFNLLKNAVKYTKKGSISLKVNQTGFQVIFSVEDTGCGMPEEVVKDLLPKDTVTPHKTCGLGLTVSSMICHRMGANLAVTSALDKGTTFTFSLPIKGPIIMDSNSPISIPSEECKVNSTIRFNQTITGTWSFKPPSKITILIVDDNSFNRFTEKKLLEKYPFNIREAEDGDKAVKTLYQIQRTGEDTKILIFMDLDMPVMNGVQATKEIRRLDTKPRPYIWALTAFASECERKECMEAGMDGFISKPLTKQNMRNLFIELGFISCQEVIFIRRLF